MDVFNTVLDWLGNQINNLLSFLCVVLPDSPFQALSNSPIGEYLGIINYFVPIDFMLNVTTAWLACILVYYGFSILMRWVKAIQ